jgi:CheY-like chemotaxis protein
MSRIFLLIDDDRAERGLFTEAIKTLDHDITCYLAEDGKEALELLSNQSNNLPHVIFLDVNMPGMNGWFCLKNLKENESYKDIPVIMYSTSSYQRDIDMAIQLGAICFCVKPESFKTLIKIIEVVSDNIGDDLLAGIKLHKAQIDSFKGIA